MKREYLRNIGVTEVSKAWLRDIELIVENILFKGQPVVSIESIDKVLSKLCPGYSFEIKVVDADVRTPFIMSIYPELQQLEDRCYKLGDIINDPKQGSDKIMEQWSAITKWSIEIDRKLLAKGNYQVANGREFVAILMHEIGHVATMNNHILVRNYRKNKAKFKMVEKLMLSESYMVRKVFLPMFIHTLNFRVITNGHLKNDLEEIKADLFIPDAYKGDLVSYLDRCILTNPDAINTIIVTNQEFDSDQTVAVSFTRETLLLMSKRRDILARYVQAQYKTTKSPYLKAFTKRFGQIYSGVKVDGDEAQMDIVKEGAKCREFQQELSLYEAKAAKILNEAQRVSDRDLSILQVESESMESNDDKMYVLHTIYDYLEMIEAEHHKKNKNISSEEIEKDSRVIYLKSLRNTVLKNKIQERQYGVFVKYPVGYEG